MAKGLTAGELRVIGSTTFDEYKHIEKDRALARRLQKIAIEEPSVEEALVQKLKEAKEELFNLRFQAATGQLESHGRLRAVRREIARIYTVMRERELGIVTTVEEESSDG